MKKFYYSVIGLLLLSCFHIWAQNSTQIYITEVPPTIDGIVDDAWNDAIKIPMNTIANEGSDDISASGTWSALWDENNIYFLIEAVDDVRMNTGSSDGSTPWYLHDCIEIFTDLNNLKNNEAVTNSDGQYQLRFIYGLDDEPMNENPSMTGYENVSADNTDGDGYIIEVSMPWSVLTEGMTTPVVIAPGLTLGMDFKLTDIDADHGGDWWPDHYEYAWNSAAEKKPINFGNVTLRGQKDNIYSTAVSPAIDGAVDAVWNNVEKIPIANLANEGTGDPTVSGTWSALWDETNVYFLVEVIDDVRMNTGSSDGSTPWYLHDCVEIFTDLNNRKNNEAVTNTDGQYQLRFIYGLDDEPMNENPSMTGYENVSADNATGDGYIIEVSMPWSNLLNEMTEPVTVETGLTIGLDLKLTDMDADHGGDWWPSHYEYAWNSAAEKKPINFGTVTLQEMPYKKAEVWSTGSAPVIDGDIDALWANAEKIAINEISNPGTGDPTISGTWSSMWDDDNAYFLIEVIDDIAMNTGSSDGSTPWYLHDCIEIFTDMNNSRSDEEITNSNGQYQLRFIYGMDDEPMYENQTMTGYSNVSKDNEAGDGYVIEISMPWSVLTASMATPITIGSDLEIGMDFKLTDIDADHGGDWWPSHYELVWNSASNKLPANFGSIILKKSPDTEAPNAPANLTDIFSNEDRTITLNWDAATDNEGVISYNVYNDDALIANVSELTYSMNLNAGTTYNFTVTAMDAAGNESDPSNIITETTTGTTPLPDGGTIIGSTAVAPVIDGDVDAVWDNANKYIVSPFGSRAEAVSLTDFSASYSAMWDNDNLYLLFEVSDDILLHNDYYANGNVDGYYVHDCVEFFIGDEANLKQYHYRFIYNLDDEVNYDPVPSGYTNVSKSTTNGYNIEASIPWASLANDTMTMPEIKRAAAINFWAQITDLDRESTNPGWFDISTHSLWPIGSGPGILALADANEVIIDNEAPAPPTNVSAVANSVLPQITLTWEASISEDVLTYYVLQGDIIVSAGTQLSAEVIGLDPETEYTFTVVAVDGENLSASSETASATTGIELLPLVARIPKTDLTGEDPFYEFDMGAKNGNLPEYEMKRRLEGIMTEEEFKPSWSAVWNEDYLYLRVKVLDDVVFNGGENTWQNDQVSIYFDMWNDNSKDNPASTHPGDENYQDDCMQYRVIAMDNDTKSGSSLEYDTPCTDANCHPDENVGVLNWTGVNFLSYIYGQSEGYIIDIQFPWSSLGCVFDGGCISDITEGLIFGFDIDATDYDETDNDPDVSGIQAANSSMWSTWSPYNLVQQHRNNSEWGDIELVLEVGVEDCHTTDLTVYPVPANDLINVSIPQNDNFDRIEIMDITGRKVLTQAVEAGNNKVSIPVSHLNKGVYTVYLHGQQKSFKTKVIVN